MARTSAPVHELELVGVGSVVVDRIARTPRIIGPEEKISLLTGKGGLYLEHVGGVTLNHLAWASLMGARVGLAGRAATDPEATVVREGMRNHGITPHLVEDGSATAVSMIFVDPRGERAIYMSRGTNAETDAAHLRHHHRDWLRAAKYVSTEISQVPLDGVIEVLEQARAGGAVTVLDLDIPRADAVASLGTPAQFDRALALADILKPAKGALAGLGIEADDALGFAMALRDRFGSTAVVVTDGARGCALSTASFSGRVPALPVGLVLDTTGAGDAFLGGLLAARIQGLEWDQAARVANACGAACVEHIGAVPQGEASRQRVLELVGAKISAALRAPGTAGRGVLPGGEGAAARRMYHTAVRSLQRLQREPQLQVLQSVAQRILLAEQTGGRVHVTGVGKPGHVASYAASLLASTGTPATVLHATEASHGSAGQVCPGDIVIAISNSGGTEELLRAVDAVLGRGATVVGVTGNPESALAKRSEWTLVARAEDEGGPLGLAPRASVLVEHAVLMALSCELQDMRGLTRAEYGQRHPSGALGRRATDLE